MNAIDLIFQKIVKNSVIVRMFYLISKTVQLKDFVRLKLFVYGNKPGNNLVQRWS